MKRIIKIILSILLFLLIAVFCFLFVGSPEPAEDIKWGVNFSKEHSRNLGLDWKENYNAVLEDLDADHLKIVAYWTWIEPQRDQYNFDNLDWQIERAAEEDAKLLLVMGQRVPRWPECHFPGWVKELSTEERQEEIMELTEKIVKRYKDEEAIWAWQVENEPFFSFGECPPPDEDFIKKEVESVKEMDPSRPVVVTESGEWPFWFKAAQYGDIVGTTLYREVWMSEWNRYFKYPLPPVFYQRKAKLINWIFDKKVINVEMQTEPWGPELMYDISLEEQKKTMDLEQFKKNIDYARRTGLDTFYLWGSEWWYWLKTNHNQPQIWNEASKLFSN
ncbi:MAG: beta-galactosidase [Candidatus Paceibacterota bacterium]